VHRSGIRRLVGIQGFSVGLQSDAARSARLRRSPLPSRAGPPGGAAGTARPHQHRRAEQDHPNLSHDRPPPTYTDNYVYCDYDAPLLPFLRQMPLLPVKTTPAEVEWSRIGVSKSFEVYAP